MAAHRRKLNSVVDADVESKKNVDETALVRQTRWTRKAHKTWQKYTCENSKCKFTRPTNVSPSHHICDERIRSAFFLYLFDCWWSSAGTTSRIFVFFTPISSRRTASPTVKRCRANRIATVETEVNSVGSPDRFLDTQRRRKHWREGERKTLCMHFDSKMIRFRASIVAIRQNEVLLTEENSIHEVLFSSSLVDLNQKWEHQLNNIFSLADLNVSGKNWMQLLHKCIEIERNETDKQFWIFATKQMLIYCNCTVIRCIKFQSGTSRCKRLREGERQTQNATFFIQKCEWKRDFTETWWFRRFVFKFAFLWHFFFPLHDFLMKFCWIQIETRLFFVLLSRF